MLLEAGPIPLYSQIQRFLRDQISVGALPPGAALPTEAELCDRFGVSRITVGKALNGLVANGLVVRQRGRGTFVADRPATGRTVRLIGALDDALAPVRDLSRQLLARRRITPPQEVVHLLQPRAPQSVTAGVLMLESLYTAAEGPYTLTRVYLPEEVAARLDPAILDDPRPVIDLVQEALRARVTRAEQSVDPDVARPRLARLLGIRRGAPLLRVVRTFVLASGQPVQVGIGWYHPQRYRYTVQLLPTPHG